MKPNKLSDGMGEPVPNEPSKPEPKRKRRPKKPMPPVLKGMAEKAVSRHKRRPATPEMMVKGEFERWEFDCPYLQSDRDDWQALLFDAFATRSAATFNMFMTQLAELCPKQWTPEEREWRPDATHLSAAIQIVGGQRPRNEAEACLAAQMVAIHFATMKLGGMVARTSWPDERTVATLTRAARTYAMQIDTMDRLKRGRRGRTSKQTIIVKHEKHVHNHQHVHFEEGGVPNFGGRAHAAKEGIEYVRTIDGAGKSEERAALPSPDEAGGTVPLTRLQGQEGVPDARRGSGKRRSEGDR